MQILGEVPEGSGADNEVKRLGQVPDGSGTHTQVRMRKVPVQRLGEVLEGSGADTQVGFRKVPEGSGADAEVRFRKVGSPGADFLRLVTFWSIRSSGAIRRFCVTGAALRMTWPHLFVAGAVLQTDGLEKLQKKNWHEAVSSALDSPFFEGGFAELPRF